MRASWSPTDRYRPPDGWRAPPGRPNTAEPSGEVAGESPSIVLIAFSGRCVLTSCTPPDENEDALARTLGPAVLSAWSAAGLHGEAWTYRGYAHGTQFAHLLAFEHPDVAFTASVLLDSICLGWDADHAAALVAAFAPGAGPWADDGPYQVGGAAFDAWVTWVLEVLRLE